MAQEAKGVVSPAIGGDFPTTRTVGKGFPTAQVIVGFLN